MTEPSLFWYRTRPIEIRCSESTVPGAVLLTPILHRGFVRAPVRMAIWMLPTRSSQSAIQGCVERAGRRCPSFLVRHRQRPGSSGQVLAWVARDYMTDPVGGCQTTRGRDSVEFRILGTLEIRDGAGRLVAPPRRKAAAAVGRVAAAGQHAGVGRVAARPAGGGVSADVGRANLHTYVSDLRLGRCTPTSQPTRRGWSGTRRLPASGRAGGTRRSSSSWPARAGRRWPSSATHSPPSDWPRPSPDGADRCWKTCLSPARLSTRYPNGSTSCA